MPIKPEILSRIKANDATLKEFILSLECLVSEKNGPHLTVAIKELAEAMECNTNVRSLNLNYCTLENEILRPLFDVLIKNNTLTKLSLKFNYIYDVGAKAIGQMSALEELDLADCYVGSQGMKYLANLKKLKKLIMYRNNIGDEGAMGFGQMPHLEYLNVSRNNITAVGAIAICQNIQSLKVLDISQNEIGLAGSLAVGQHPNLQAADVSYNQLDDKCALLLAKTKNIKQLAATHNNIEIAGRVALINAIKSLDINYQKIINKGSQAATAAGFFGVIQPAVENDSPEKLMVPK